MFAVHIRRSLLATTYFYGGFLVATVVAVVLPLGLALGVGLLPVFLVGLPILALTMFGWRALATLERDRAALVLGTPIVRPALKAPKGPGILNKVGAHVRTRATWKELAWTVLTIPVSVIGAAATTAAWALAFGLIGVPIAAGFAGEGSQLGDLEWWAPIVAPIGGVLMLGGAVLLAEALGAAAGALAQALLGPDDREELEHRVETLQTTRAGAVESADQTLRRIERDLHDGAQHRLAYVAMELGRARQKLKTDPEAAAPLIDRAFEESKNAMAELRDLVRGIHPSILSDRGLEAAISGLAGRCPVPVAVEVDVPQRPGVAVETAAYFVVAEALTNVGKHSGAQRALVDVKYDEAQRLTVTVADDGAGGAIDDAGGGLAGLRQRVEALDGTLLVTSPPGNGTTISAVFPAATQPQAPTRQEA